jgi:hypothetical protein
VVRILVAALVASTAVLAACEYSTFDDCAIACTSASGCPTGYSCGTEGLCRAAGASGSCAEATCRPGTMQDCYEGSPGTKGVGPCTGGRRFCDDSGAWGPCMGQVVPAAEACSDQVDNNCNGKTDELDDADGDGFTTCGGDCCDSTECPEPALVNPGAFEIAGNGVDDDCNPTTNDNAPAVCDQGLASNSTTAFEYAEAMDLCQMTSLAEKTWGVIDAKLTLASGTGVPDTEGFAIRPRFGTNVTPQAGSRMVVLSTGGAAGKTDTNPAFHAFDAGYTHTGTNSSAFPADWFTANGSKIPHAPGCPASAGLSAFDPVMLTLKLRVPTNARSFSVSTSFFAADFPEYVCSGNADVFVVLLDSTYNGAAPNPADKNLAIVKPPGAVVAQPLDVDLGFGDTGLFTQCKNGATGCTTGATPSTITTCTSTAMLTNTGFDDASANDCEATSIVGGSTGWLVTRGNVVPGEVITLRFAIWDTVDHSLDSLAILDNFRWSTETVVEPGTALP